MNRDSEHIQKRILMLLQDLFPSASLKDVEAASRALGYEAMEQPAQNKTNSIDFPSIESPMSKSSESSRSFKKESAFELGDVPAVQDRFHALLKNRLQSEIQRNPPLFPWESELQDYGTDAAQETVESLPLSAPIPPAGGSHPTWVWLRQLRTLNLPVRLPEPILASLLQQCQEVMQTPLREGAKLVRAVEELFPGQDQALNYLAGLVMTSPARSGSAMARPSEGSFPASYEAAVPAQQMVLSLLAAQEIINNLTLTVSAHQPMVERQWDTDAGLLSLQVTYQNQQPTASVSVRVALPCGGTLKLNDGDAQTVTQRSHPGYLSGELFNLQHGQLHPVEVSLGDSSQSALTFTIRIV